VLLAAELAIGLFGGTKLQVLLPLVAVAVVSGVRARRASRKTVVIIILAAIFVFPFIRQYRDFLRPTPTQRASTQEAIVEFPKVLVQTVKSFANGEAFSAAPSDIAARLRQGDNIAVIIEKTPSLIPYRPWTQELSGPIVGLVPRAIWPSKPVLSTGIDFSREYYQVPQEVLSAQAVTWPGDLYRHGGLLPVVVGMLCLGVIGRLVDETVYPTMDLRRTVMFLGLFFVMIQTENDVVSLLVGFVQAVVATAIVTKLAFVER
jgi:multisubunit Na+/H+ antiporter MnhE subunit